MPARLGLQFSLNCKYMIDFECMPQLRGRIVTEIGFGSKIIFYVEYVLLNTSKFRDGV